jgi:hypothetical protein
MDTSPMWILLNYNRSIRPYPPFEECGLGSFDKFHKGVLLQLYILPFCPLEVILWSPRLGWQNYEWFHWIPIRIGSNFFWKNWSCLSYVFVYIYQSNLAYTFIGVLQVFFISIISLIIPCSLQVSSILRIKNIYNFIFHLFVHKPNIMCNGKFDYHVLEVFHVYFWVPKKGWEGCGCAFMFRPERL